MFSLCEAWHPLCMPPQGLPRMDSPPGQGQTNNPVHGLAIDPICNVASSIPHIPPARLETRAHPGASLYSEYLVRMSRRKVETEAGE